MELFFLSVGNSFKFASFCSRSFRSSRSFLDIEERGIFEDFQHFLFELLGYRREWSLLNCVKNISNVLPCLPVEPRSPGLPGTPRPGGPTRPGGPGGPGGPSIPMPSDPRSPFLPAGPLGPVVPGGPAIPRTPGKPRSPGNPVLPTSPVSRNIYISFTLSLDFRLVWDSFPSGFQQITRRRNRRWRLEYRIQLSERVEWRREGTGVRFTLRSTRTRRSRTSWFTATRYSRRAD